MNQDLDFEDDGIDITVQNLDKEKIKQIDQKITRVSLQDPYKYTPVSVVVTKDKKQVKPLNDFVILFLNSFLDLMIKFDLQKMDMLVLFAILTKMKNGNQVSITQKAIAKELGREPSNLNRNYKKLRESKILIQDEFGNEFINTNIIVNKSLRRIKVEDLELYNKSLEESKKIDIEPNY